MYLRNLIIIDDNNNQKYSYVNNIDYNEYVSKIK